MLTERESEVSALVAQGLKNKAVAHQLGIGEGTVKLHLHNIYRKLGIKNRCQLMLHVSTNNDRAVEPRRIGPNVLEFPRLRRKA